MQSAVFVELLPPCPLDATVRFGAPLRPVYLAVDTAGEESERFISLFRVDTTSAAGFFDAKGEGPELLPLHTL